MQPRESASKTHPATAARLRELPSVDELLSRPRILTEIERAGRAIVTQVTRDVLSALRSQLKNAADVSGDETAMAGLAALDSVESRIAAEIEVALAPSLVRVINATGVILHTNLGRAPLSLEAAAGIAQTATRYSNLEYDVPSGERGKRDVHTSRRLAELTGAESAIVVNNNAAAVFLVLHTLAKGGEVIVSRGELIEIGDGFRIPDIMSESGAILREIGTTNRTRIRDYERAIGENTRLLLRVHPSNFRILGFAERPSLEELVALSRRTHLPLYEDLGSGCIADLSPNGVTEPVVRDSCRAGVAVVSFSGDKLLGGPQVGIIAGQKELVERIRRNPLFRALRVDKLTIAALEVVLRAYQRGALDEVPALRMIRLSADDIAARAENFVQQIRPALPRDAKAELQPGFSVIGGGSTPDQQLPTQLISIESRRHSASTLEERLRKPQTGLPVVARILDEQLVLDLRTVLPEEEAELQTALTLALQ